MEKVKGIYHTHSTYSKFNHGKNSVEEMILEANNLGLLQYAITDHGVRHIFGILKSKVKKLKQDIIDASKGKDLKVVMGLEFNLLSNNGDTDFSKIRKEDKNIFDIKLLGAHMGAWVGIKNFFTFYLPNIFAKNNKKVIERNTNAYISAIQKCNFDIITHPNEFVLVDIKRLAEACVENNCYLELNEKHMNLTPADVKQVLETDCKFIIGSDAHQKDRILKIDRVLEFIKVNNIPEERIANLNKLPNFKNKYETLDETSN